MGRMRIPFLKLSAGRGFVKIGGLFLWSWVVFSGASRFVSGFFLFLLTANQLVVGWFMTRQSLTTVYAIR